MTMGSGDIESIVGSLEGTTVVVVGDLILDVTIYGETERISPEAPVPILRARDTVETPGGAANVAMNVRTLGGNPILVGRVGKDASGKTLKRLLERAGIPTDWLIESDEIPTIRKTRIVARNQQVLRVDHEIVAPLRSDERRTARRFLREQAGKARAAVFSDYAKGMSASLAQDFVKTLNRLDLPFVVDPKPAFAPRFAGSFLICPNHNEAEAITGFPFGTHREVEKYGPKLRHILEARFVLITRGPDGMSLVSAKGIQHFPVARREVYDVTGAGDTVAGTLATALGAGLSLDSAIHLANLAAGVVIQKAGTATASPAEIAALARGHRAKILSMRQLIPIITRLRGSGQRIVFTNGIFDLLHPGHLHYLQAAKALGDVLIVGVNTDESSRRLKGPGRPINPLSFRLEMLSGLQCVDYLVPFNTLTPLPLIRAIRPDILAKGGDYTPERVVGKNFVESYGGKVAILPFTPGFSSSELIQKIRASKPSGS